MAAANISDDSVGFLDLGLDQRLVDSLTALGYEEPTPIQREAIPPLIEGKDLLGQAATGTGKTAAFSLPLLQRLSLSNEDRRQPSSLILVPTRELAMQVAEAIHRYGRPFGVSVLPVFGGQSFSQQLRALKRGVDVVVATPGRALDHINRGTLDLSGLDTVVLDEADEMLDMGFAEDLESILGATPQERQTVLFSATMPKRIEAITRRHLTDPVQIRIAREKVAAGDAPRVRQTAYMVPRSHKMEALGRVLDVEAPDAALIFCRTRNEVDELSEKMTAHGYRAEAIHGGLSQDQRDRVMNKLRNGSADLLVATDVAARGLDISRLTHVINFDPPAAPESYVHRIGRVGRAGREGVAITLIEPREQRLLRNIETLTKQKIQIATVPTVADLRARRMETLKASLREILETGEAEAYRAVVDALSSEFGPLEVAMAATKMADAATGADVEEANEIPQVTFNAGRGRDGGEARGSKGTSRRKRAAERSASMGDRPAASGMSRLFLGAGRQKGIRPTDIVGAITGEAGVSGREIGTIEISDRFSIVEVSDHIAATVLDALRGAQIKGKKVKVRMDRGDEDSRPRGRR